MKTASATGPRFDASCAETGGMRIDRVVRVLALAAQQPGGRFQRGPVFSFGPFRQFPSQRLLQEGNRAVHLGSRAFDILTVLVERAGAVVSKDTLMTRVWPNVFVEDSNLKTQIRALRRTLDEAGAGGRFIVTVPGRGYSFVALVSFAAGTAPDQSRRRQADRPDHPYGEARPDGTVPVMSLPELIRVFEPCN